MKDYVLPVTPIEIDGKNLPEQLDIFLNHITIHNQILEWHLDIFTHWQHVSFPPTGSDPNTRISSTMNLSATAGVCCLESDWKELTSILSQFTVGIIFRMKYTSL